VSSNEDLFKRAQEVIPGGVNSPVRAFKSVGGTPYFVARAEGAYVWDVEGRQYIDYVQSYGASILGHAHPKVVEAIRRAALDGTTYGAPTEREVLLAETICERVGGCDMLRLVSSGTEAAMSAVRVARGFTGRDKVVIFEGNYHGHSDGLLAAGGSGMATLALPASAGVPADMVANTVVGTYGTVPHLDETVAAVIVEPIGANHGLLNGGAGGFLAGLRAECDRIGALLIFDEVITGFRVCNGGLSNKLPFKPDLWCFGKIIGGGLPLAAFGGRRDVMEVLAPIGPVYQAGTLSGNPIATAAGLAVLGLLDEGVYERLWDITARLAGGFGDALRGTGVDVHLIDNLLWLEAPEYPRLFHHMLDRGVALAPGAYEILFPSVAHGDDEIDRTLEAASSFR
jgi:glutamate-1-semialdehyde 2,1-aminomutase